MVYETWKIHEHLILKNGWKLKVPPWLRTPWLRTPWCIMYQSTKLFLVWIINFREIRSGIRKWGYTLDPLVEWRRCTGGSGKSTLDCQMVCINMEDRAPNFFKACFNEKIMIHHIIFGECNPQTDSNNVKWSINYISCILELDFQLFSFFRQIFLHPKTNRFSQLLSLDWFTGQTTGNPIFLL